MEFNVNETNTTTPVDQPTFQELNFDESLISDHLKLIICQAIKKSTRSIINLIEDGEFELSMRSQLKEINSKPSDLLGHIGFGKKVFEDTFLEIFKPINALLEPYRIAEG